MFVRLERRPTLSGRMHIVAPLLSVALTFIFGSLIFAMLGISPLHAYEVIFLNPLKSTYGLAELFLKATPLIMIATGLAIGFRAGVFNIGAEGQYIAGAVAATGVVLYAGEQQNSVVLLGQMMLAGLLGGMLLAAIVAWLRVQFNANEILVSLMLVYIAQLAASWLIHGPWRDPGGYGFPQSKVFPDNALLPILLEGARVNVVSLLAILLLLLSFVFIFRSFAGFKMQLNGYARSAMRYAGFSSNSVVWTGMLAGGGMAGLAGMAEVSGPAGQLTEYISNGYGFAAIIVAFIGRLHPFGIVLAGLLMALLYLGGEQARYYLSIPASIGYVFQGMLLFFLLGCDVFTGYRCRMAWPLRWGA